MCLCPSALHTLLLPALSYCLHTSWCGRWWCSRSMRLPRALCAFLYCSFQTDYADLSQSTGRSPSRTQESNNRPSYTCQICFVAELPARINITFESSRSRVLPCVLHTVTLCGLLNSGSYYCLSSSR